MVAAVLVLLHVITQIISFSYHPTNESIVQLIARFNLDNEFNLPSLFSVILLLTAAVTLTVIAIVKFRAKDKYRRHWAFLAVILLWVGIDEGTAFHEIVGTLNIPTELGITNPFLYYAWVFPAFFIVVGLVVFFMRFYWNLPCRTKTLFAIAAAIYISGSLGMEAVSGYYVANGGGLGDFTYNVILVTIEESLEMIGIVTFIASLLDYVKTQRISVELYFK